MVSTGLAGLDKILTGLRKGDNVVWQIETLADYEHVVKPYVKHALAGNNKVVYIRFAQHKSLLPQHGAGAVTTYHLDATLGFESFTSTVHAILAKEGKDTYYVFDCLSDLLPAWATDLMIGNFFMVTCPYLYELDTLAYFAILRNNHSFKTIARIRETTQLLLDVYHCDNICYVHPLKVWNRYTHTMFLPHLKNRERFLPVTDSANAARLFSHIHKKGTEDAQRNLDYWDRLFWETEETLKRKTSAKKRTALFDQLANIIMTRDEKIMALIKKYFTLEDLFTIKSRVIGTGLIGGKAVGMLLARKILSHDPHFDASHILEAHDSFYIGADVFYTYLVQNGWWKERTRQRTPQGYFEIARSLRDKLPHGKLPEEINEQLQQMIEYFGTSPIIVRSSSLLEDGLGNAFAGKYESVFCANQGTPEERTKKFIDAVKTVYASTMSEEALNYRIQRGLGDRDEQMALLVQRVSGSYHKHYFFPDIAGVGVSYNTYVWNEKLSADAGMVRLVAGLGTRAVDRVEGDYARIVALDEPTLRPFSTIDEIRKFSQRYIDVIDIKKNVFSTIPFTNIVGKRCTPKLGPLIIKDDELTAQLHDRGMTDQHCWLLSFDTVLAKTSLVTTLQKILRTLQTHYHYPVDIEFTVNLTPGNDFKLNLLQCRSLQVHGLGKKIAIPKTVAPQRLIFTSTGSFLGGNTSQPIKRIIYVDPHRYLALSLQDKYQVARIIGKLNRQIEDKEKMPTLLLGPGRWGTSTPTLGVPVSFFEINNITTLVEIAVEEGSLIPELSFGTHFFQDLVESAIFYIALFPQHPQVSFNTDWFSREKNHLEKYVPEDSRFSGIVNVYDLPLRGVKLIADILTQKIICFCEH